MISQTSNTRSLPDQVSDILTDTGIRLTREQAGIAETYYNRRSGLLSSRLKSKPFIVSASGTGANLTINYPLYIRFLDLSKIRSGKRKSVYFPIYNRPVWGYIYGYAYKLLRLGLSNNIRDRVFGPEKKVKIDINQPL